MTQLPPRRAQCQHGLPVLCAVPAYDGDRECRLRAEGSGVPKRRAREMAARRSPARSRGLERRFPSELSGGQQQRVAVARALVLEPLVLLFDEPLSNLDAKLRRRMRDDIRDLQSRLNLTVVYVTHDQQEALAISDQDHRDGAGGDRTERAAARPLRRIRPMCLSRISLGTPISSMPNWQAAPATECKCGWLVSI